MLEESDLGEEDLEYYGTPGSMPGFISAAKSGYVLFRRNISFMILFIHYCFVFLIIQALFSQFFLCPHNQRFEGI